MSGAVEEYQSISCAIFAKYNKDLDIDQLLYDQNINLNLFKELYNKIIKRKGIS